MSSLVSRLSAILLLLLVLSCMSSGAPTEPQHPGDYASPEQMTKYYEDLWQYITFVTRPRFGKRWDEVGVENISSF
ncbi:pancreatic polypeptide prohormone-like [Discoglossus pictus]